LETERPAHGTREWCFSRQYCQTGCSWFCAQYNNIIMQHEETSSNIAEDHKKTEWVLVDNQCIWTHDQPN